MQSVDVLVVGAGPAGIGMALELSKIADLVYGVFESGRIGESFRRWPAQTRFITPSFYGNPFGLADLNSVNAESSPAVFAGVEHLSGEQYADYLNVVVHASKLPVLCSCKVLQVNPHPDGGFHLVTERGELFTKFLIWACGEYQFPDLNPFPGGHSCVHYAQIDDWRELETDTYIVIGGYESGLDSAINLLQHGCQVRLLVRSPTWDLSDVYDPSKTLSPYTRQRLHEVESNDRLQIIFDVDVVKVASNDSNGFRVHAADGRYWDVTQPPILGTGFIKGGGAKQIKDLWMWGDDGHIVLSDIDESTQIPGLFLVGPQVRHDQRIYCFIYKFRQRFARIARQIAERLHLNIEPPEGSKDGVWGPFGNSECCEGCEC